MINKTCHIGIGGCGNKLVNTLMEINSSVNGIFINTNINEMKKLSKFDVDLGNYLYINGDGTGRDPQRAEELLNANKQKIGEFFKSKEYSNWKRSIRNDGQLQQAGIRQKVPFPFHQKNVIYPGMAQYRCFKAQY